MGSVVIVAVYPSLIGISSRLVGVVVADVGPFRGEGAMEAFDFPVRLRSVRSGVSMDHVSQSGVEQR